MVAALLLCEPLTGDDQGVANQVKTDRTEPADPAPPESQATAKSKELAEDEDREMSVWMDRKLKHSQAILRSLAMGDMKDVQYNAARLKLLNRVEGFVRRRNPDYRAHLQTFARISTRLERQAEKGNIEGVTLAFNQLTISCVDCHQMLRREESAEK